MCIRDRVGSGEAVGQAFAEKDVVAKHHRRRRAAKEFLGKDICLRQTIWRRLNDIVEGHAPIGPIAE